jgi:hypothetical protein
MWLSVEPDLKPTLKDGLVTALRHLGINFYFGWQGIVHFRSAHKPHTSSIYPMIVEISPTRPSTVFAQTPGFLCMNSNAEKGIPIVGKPRKSQGGEPIFWFRNKTEKIPAFELKGNILSCNIDIFSIISWILRKQTARSATETLDSYPLFRHLTSNFRVPIVDEYVEFFWEALKIACRIRDIPLLRIRPWPVGLPACCITHDIDYIRTNFSQDLFRSIRDLKDLRMKRCFRNVFSGLLKLLVPSQFTKCSAVFEPELQRLDSLIKFDQHAGIRPTYFIMPQGTDGYSPSDPSLSTRLNLLNLLKYEVALHAPPDYLGRNLLSKFGICGQQDFVGVRYHNLEMPSKENRLRMVFRESNIQYDSTVGYENIIGFRSGTCRPYKIYRTQITELPLTLMDVTLQKTPYRYSEIVDLIDKVSLKKGIFVFLFHPNYIDRDLELYKNVIRDLRERNFWMTTCKEATERWSSLSSVNVEIDEQKGIFILQSSKKIKNVLIEIFSDKERKKMLDISEITQVDY